MARPHQVSPHRARHLLGVYAMDSRIRRTVSSGWSQCGKWPQSENQCSFASGYSCWARVRLAGGGHAVLAPPADRHTAPQRTCRCALLFRPVDESVQRGVEAWGLGEVAQFRQDEVRRQLPRPGGELQEQRRPPDRTAGQGGQQRLDALDQRDRRPHRRPEHLHLTIGPEPTRVEGDDVAGVTPPRHLERHPGAHRAAHHVPRPSSAMNFSTASVSDATVTSPGSGGLSPNPGKSTAMTVRCRASAGTMGSQLCRFEMPWTSSSGFPAPVFTECM